MENQNWKRNIACFLSAQTLSLFGSSLVQYAIVWHITLTTSSGRMLTLSTLCGFLPQIAISLFAGAWLDRYDRKRIIMLADSAIAAVTLLLALLFLCGRRDTWFLFLALAVRSAGTGVQTPAVNAVLPQIVPKGQLMKMNGINSTLSSMMMFLSPAASGAVLSVAPLETVLFIDVFTAVIGVSITSAVQIGSRERKKPDSKTDFQKLREGFAYLRENSFVRRLLLYQIVILFLISPSAFLTPLMVSRTFGGEVWRLTASEMTYSLGMVLGGVLIASWGGFKNRMDTVIAAGAAYGLFMLGLGLAPLFSFYLLCNTLIGLTSPCYNTPVTVSLQERADPDMHGRVFSLMQIASSCALPLGMCVFGPLADAVRVQWILLAAGSMVLAISAFIRKKDFL